MLRFNSLGMFGRACQCCGDEEGKPSELHVQLLWQLKCSGGNMQVVGLHQISKANSRSLSECFKD